MFHNFVNAIIRSLAVTAVLVAGASHANAQAPLVKVEEVWELVVQNPNYDATSPQIAIQMKPDAGSDQWYAMFCLNYREIPDFDEGGVEIQLWNQDWVVAMDNKAGHKFSIDGEVVTWTQTLEIKDEKLQFSISDGQSQTFGAFGGEGFGVSQPSDKPFLLGYHVDASINDSAINFGANCVKSLRIREVRYHRHNVSEPQIDKTVRVVYESPSE